MRIPTEAELEDALGIPRPPAAWSVILRDRRDSEGKTMKTMMIKQGIDERGVRESIRVRWPHYEVVAVQAAGGGK